MAERKLVVLCDGTWCGRATGTESNINKLAAMVGIDMNGSTYEVEDHVRKVQARYFEGAGLGGTFIDYLFDGATAYKIQQECLDVYRYIVEKYTSEHEIWMFRLSRGSYTLRCVAGLINNCGIVKVDNLNNDERETLYKMVYQMYRSNSATEEPASPNMRSFREKASHQVRTPVKFMGILDTVGSLGIPRLNAGIGFDWEEFHDQNISSVVEKVYHAVSMHDTFWIFEPCLALRDGKHDSDTELQIHEKWFPGTHYDIGRQRFRFLEVNSPTQKVISYFPQWAQSVAWKYVFGRTVAPDEVLADLVLEWMLEGVQTVDLSGTVIPTVAEEIKQASNSTKAKNAVTGDGDIYKNILNYIPFGTIVNSITTAANGMGGQFVNAITAQSIIFYQRDRCILTPTADVYRYKEIDGERDRSVASLAQITPERYPSKTFESFQLRLLDEQIIDRQTYNERVGTA